MTVDRSRIPHGAGAAFVLLFAGLVNTVTRRSFTFATSAVSEEPD